MEMGLSMSMVQLSELSCQLITNRYSVEFRLIVFRPFKHEVLIGRISSAVLHGIRSTYLIPQPFCLI
jgi:DNA-directed RNA polymerase subunit E'/Rpb7